MTAWMKHKQLEAAVNKLQRQKVSFWTFQTAFISKLPNKARLFLLIGLRQSRRLFFSEIK